MDMNWFSDYDSPNHLDIIFFGIVWSFLMIEYYLWRVNK
jgi:hypothetical protein